MTEKSKKSWCGCLAGGCLLVVVALAIGLYYAYVKTLEAGREFAAKALVAAVEVAVRENLDQAEQKKAMQPVEELAQKVRDGQVSLKQTTDLGKAFLASPLIPAFVTSAFQKKYLNSPDMPDTEREAAKMTTSRFTRGICDGTIPVEQVNIIMDSISVESVKDGRRTKALKKELTHEELEHCLELMKNAADTGKIEEKLFQIDLAAEIRKVIDHGMSGDIPDTTPDTTQTP